ncbi:MAG: hypothetical protein QE271_14640 [Bacteriovoracaceae bacterium]|nr:hypothetical protein [Bacteriovoracaceae bacterium]
MAFSIIISPSLRSNEPEVCDYGLTKFEDLVEQNITNLIAQKILPSDTIKVFKNESLEVYIVIQSEEGIFVMSEYDKKTFEKLTPLKDKFDELPQPSFLISGVIIEKDLKLGFGTKSISPIDGKIIRAKHFSGKLCFAYLAKHFEGEFNRIVAEWGDGDNLEAFNEARKRGMSLTDAAFETWTGQRAKEIGYTVATLDGFYTRTKRDLEGNLIYDQVGFIFTKPK